MFPTDRNWKGRRINFVFLYTRTTLGNYCSVHLLNCAFRACSIAFVISVTQTLFSLALGACNRKLFCSLVFSNWKHVLQSNGVDTDSDSLMLDSKLFTVHSKRSNCSFSSYCRVSMPFFVRLEKSRKSLNKKR